MERTSATEVLFSKTQQRLLRALFSGIAPEGMPYAELLDSLDGDSHPRSCA